MTASELRELAQRLCAVEPHDYEGRAITEAAAEVLELVAWAEESEVPLARKWDGIWSVGHSSKRFEGLYLIDTLRRAKEASRG